ncbi:hypothetical protein PsYK624_112260 [Phanerochaete sordida]|uniref:F-box domain-containing protein n=1 Tax=Phanerochaete sordida TaxID=48140 RepID=A0A9P3GG78_9APHY|nr:hypothetical protein PsYK624_112260 [Phanerochaete sordida]
MALNGNVALEKDYIHVDGMWTARNGHPVLKARQLVASEAFSGVERLRNLKCLHIHDIPVYLVQGHITSMVRAWPQLEDLSFAQASPEIVFPIRITIEDLYPLVEHCPNLAWLTISVTGSGGSQAPFDFGAETVVPRPWRLRHLDFRHSDIQSGLDCERISWFLSMVTVPQGPVFTLWPENEGLVKEVMDLLHEF